MKIYHKFLLYQNKWIHPYVRMTVGVMTSITYLASILLIVGVVYEHGFTISEVEAHQLQRLYHGVWIVFLVDVTLRILLEYKDTRRTFSKLTWILTILLYLTLIPVIFHRPEEEGAILQFWEFLHGKAYHLVLLLVFSFFSLSNGLVRLFGAAYEPFAYSGCKFPDNHNDRHGAVDVAALHDERHIVGRLAVHIHQCGVRHGADVCRCGVHFYPDRFCGNHSADSDRRSGSDDTDELLCHVLHG